MIVNPQLLNYRLIVSSLLIVLTVLGAYSIDKYKSVESYETFLEQEKVLIETELTELLSSYDALNKDYDLMSLQLKKAQEETRTTLDSLRILEGNLSIVTKYKAQLAVLKLKSKNLLATIDSLNLVNKQLQEDKRYALNTIKKNSSTISDLEETNSVLNASLNTASVLKASHINAESYKLKSGKKRITDKAKRVNAIDVCITLNENALAERGNKDIYIQIVNPSGNVVSNTGEVVFGDSSLIYSQKKVVNYKNENLEICTPIIADNKDNPLLEGYYFVHVFHENTKLGSTSLKLK
ncbi:hypothetical protein [Winogradskyella arenosi]|uniref:Uncharacterized protein n=1 Tax=Winogradskyella arenosi TaxID=533325 RepID=A0A368ZJF2_9FLAO|nr:hypothetical protein [Winogradskyella arenosi]RCW93864.1 hypothetical protein DFQ08_101663 [Winogradskyella arenosi]